MQFIVCFKQHFKNSADLNPVHTSLTAKLLLVYHAFSVTTQCSALHLKFKCYYVVVPQCSNWCRDGKSSIATHYNVDAMEYKQTHYNK